MWDLDQSEKLNQEIAQNHSPFGIPRLSRNEFKKLGTEDLLRHLLEFGIDLSNETVQMIRTQQMNGRNLLGVESGDLLDDGFDFELASSLIRFRDSVVIQGK